MHCALVYHHTILNPPFHLRWYANTHSLGDLMKKRKSIYAISDKYGNDFFIGNAEECAEKLGYSTPSRVSQIASRFKTHPNKKVKRYHIRLLEGEE